MNNAVRAAVLVQYFGHLVEAVKAGAGEAYRDTMDDVNIELINELGLPMRKEENDLTDVPNHALYTELARREGVRVVDIPAHIFLQLSGLEDDGDVKFFPSLQGPCKALLIKE